MALLSNKSAMVFYVDSMRLEGVELVHVLVFLLVYFIWVHRTGCSCRMPEAQRIRVQSVGVVRVGRDRYSGRILHLKQFS